MDTIRFKRLHPDARLPARRHPGDAGLDLFPAGNQYACNCALAVRTGVAVEVPAGHVGLICGRSGLASRGVTIRGGVIDHGYSGEVVVLLHADGELHVTPGQAIAQLLIVPIATPTPEWAEELTPTPRGGRGEAGFGSTDDAGAGRP
jgi:dUTP pyrophosphatase